MSARLIVSCMSATPGPDVVVTPRLPPNEAPSAAPTAAISSSAWNVMTLKFLCFESSCSTSLAGVIGYVPRNTVKPLSSLTATMPSAVVFWSAVVNNAQFGLFARDPASALVLTDSVVRANRPLARGGAGRGVSVQEGARASLTGTAVIDSLDFGVVGGGMPGKVMKSRNKITHGAPIADVLG